jgi:WD40 repeat protein
LWDVRDVAFSPPGKSMVTTSFDGTARLWLMDLTLKSEFSLTFQIKSQPARHRRLK